MIVNQMEEEEEEEWENLDWDGWKMLKLSKGNEI
jgi:hypothetical protein